MTLRPDAPLSWGVLSRVDPGVIGGLVVEYGSHGRSIAGRTPYGYEGMEFWESQQAVIRALSAAARGEQPSTPVTELPGWVSQVLRAQLAFDARHAGGSFAPVRLLELAGLVTLEHDDIYVLAMLAGLPDPAAWVRDDPQLLSVFWRLFEIPGTPEVNLGSIDVQMPAGLWRRAFVTLVRSGVLARGAVLDACLAGLVLDFATTCEWYARLFVELRPSHAELRARQASLRTLLTSHFDATKAFAVNGLSLLAAVFGLDEVAAAPALAWAMTGTAGLALDALDLLETIGRRNAHADVVSAISVAMMHADPDVRARAEALLHWLVDDTPPPVQAVPAPAPALPRVPQPRSAPTTTLADRIVAVIDDPSDPWRLERVLADLAAGPDPDLVTRAARARRARHEVSLSARVAAILDPTRPRYDDLPYPSALFLIGRLQEIAGVLSGETEPRELLATPDHPAGWVMPDTLVARANRLTSAPWPHDLVAALLRLAPQGRERALGQLRVAGEVGRVLRYALGGDPVPVEAVLSASRWVAASRSRAPFDTDPVLIAAGLTGSGQGRPLIARVQVDALNRYVVDDVEPMRVSSWSTRVVPEYPAWSRRGHQNRPSRLRQPTAVGASVRPSGPGLPGTADWFAWSATIWPAVADHFLVDATPRLVESAWRCSLTAAGDDRRILESLAAHQGRLGALSAAAITAGLAVFRSQDRARAIDVLLDTHTSGRLNAADLGDGLVSVAGPCAPSMLAISLGELAGRGARDLVIDGLTRALPRLDPQLRGLNRLMARLNDEQRRRGTATTDPDLLAWLRRVADAGGKSGRAALPLLDHAADPIRG
jgi:hypothetical protein